MREASSALTSALGEITTSHHGAASVKQISHRTDLSALVRSLHRFHATAAGVGGAFQETARTAPVLVDARAANQMVKATPDEDAPRSSGSAAAVAPKDIAYRRAIPLPPVLRERVEDIGLQVASASRASLRATLAADDPRVAPGPPTGRSVWNQVTERLSYSQDLQDRHLSPASTDRATGPQR